VKKQEKQLNDVEEQKKELATKYFTNPRLNTNSKM
jgi:hypothetical protein